MLRSWMSLFCAYLVYADSPDIVDYYVGRKVTIPVSVSSAYSISRFRANFKSVHLDISSVDTDSFLVTDAVISMVSLKPDCDGNKYCYKGTLNETALGLEIKTCLDYIYFYRLQNSQSREFQVKSSYQSGQVCAPLESEQNMHICHIRNSSTCLSDCLCGFLHCQTSRASGALETFSLCLPWDSTIEDHLKICSAVRFSVTRTYDLCPSHIEVEEQEHILILSIIAKAVLGTVVGILVVMTALYCYQVKVKKREPSDWLPDCLFPRFIS